MKSRWMTVAVITLVGLLYVAGSIAPRYAMAQTSLGVDRALTAPGAGASADCEDQNEVENGTGTRASADHEGQNEAENGTDTGTSAEHEGQNAAGQRAGAEHEAQNEGQSAPED